MQSRQREMLFSIRGNTNPRNQDEQIERIRALFNEINRMPHHPPRKGVGKILSRPGNPGSDDGLLEGHDGQEGRMIEIVVPAALD